MKRTFMNSQRPLSCPAVDIRLISLRDSERGSILIITMWVVLVLTGLVLVFSRSMRVEAIASANHISSLEAEEIARGAISFVKARLNEEDTALKLEGETPYEAIPVSKGLFWLLRPNLEDDDTYYYGIRDEAANVNLNTADYETLMNLPNMTSELAASIIDWRDSDSELTDGGAESEYYLLLEEPYYCKDSALESVEEVLLIKGASLEILFGEDTNRNGILDPNENDGDESEPDDNRNGRLDRGFYDYVTVYSVEPNKNSEGEQRLDITSSEGKRELRSLLQRIITDTDRQLYLSQMLNLSSFTSILDLYVKLELSEDEFRLIENEISASSEETIIGLININTAPKEVIKCIPGIEDADAEILIKKRQSDGVDTDSIAWVYEALPDKASSIGEYITINSYQYSADIISVSGDGRSFCRYRMVADTMEDTFDVIYWKALKQLGWPLYTEIIKILRSGGSLEEI